MNKVILIGNVVNDPEIRTLDSGAETCSFRLAVQRRYTNAQGKREADFFPIVTWNTLAKNCWKFLGKGRKCAVEGQIQTRNYKAQDGTTRYVTEIVAENVEFLSPAPEAQQEPKGNGFMMEPTEGDDLPY